MCVCLCNRQYHKIQHLITTVLNCNSAAKKLHVSELWWTVLLLFFFMCLCTLTLSEVLIHPFFKSKIGAVPHLDAQHSSQHFVYDPVPRLANNIQILLERQNV